MNKLLVSDIINLNSGTYNVYCKSKTLDIEINGEVIIYLCNETLEKINIFIKDESSLDIYKFNKFQENNLIVNIKQNDNSKLNYNESIINNKENSLVINNDILGNNNVSNINIRNICNLNNSKIIINVCVKENTINNIALEDLKGINNGGFIHIEPNIICLSNEVEANHLTTIGSLDPVSLDYLMSKGISLEKAKEILLKGFIFSNMNEYIKKNFGGE